MEEEYNASLPIKLTILKNCDTPSSVMTMRFCTYDVTKIQELYFEFIQDLSIIFT